MSPSLHYDPEQRQLRISGEWTLDHYAHITQLLSAVQADWVLESLQGDQLTQLDTVAGQLLVHALGVAPITQLLADKKVLLSPSREALLQTLIQALAEQKPEVPATPRSVSQSLGDYLVGIGQFSQQMSRQSLALVAFMGMTLSVLFSILLHPKRWRVTSFFSHLEQTGFNALPIVVLLTFLIGAVVAFLGATLLTKFGANIYTVHLVAFSFLREFGPLLAAIIIAGRTASAFTAQIGSMRAREEIDAIRVLGLNPIELLVIPRLLALMIALPLLTFVAMMSGILGGMLVAQFTLDISNTMFLSVMQQNVGLNHFWVGISKAPFFAFVIVMISCLEGFKVSGSAQSVGEHTTASVVQSIFMVIVIDAIFAIVCMEMGW